MAKVIATGQFTVYLVSDDISARLSSDIHGIPTDANGNNSNYAGASTTLTILEGAEDVTSMWNISVAETNVKGTRSGFTYTVSEIYDDSAVVVFTATRENYPPLSKEFKVFKNRQGIAGEDARNYYLNTDVSNIKQLKDGSFIPSNIEFQGKLRVGSKFPVDYLGYFVIYEQSRNSITIDDYTNLAEQGLIAPDSEYIVSDLAYPYVERYASTEPESYVLYDYKANPNMLLIEFYDDIERSVLLDVKTIPIVVDGSNAYNMYVMPSDGIVFKFDKDGNSVGISSTTLTANVTNVENASFVWEKNGVVVDGNTTNTLSVNSSDLTGVDSITYKCTIYGAANGTMIELSDTVTVINTKDGLNGLPAYSIGLTNETVNISTESNGTGYDLANARTGVILYLGTTRKTGSIGTITASGCTAQTDGTTMWLTGINSGVNDGYVDIQIKDGATIVGVKRFTFSKNKKGDTGAVGNGIASTSVSYQNHTSGSVAPTGAWSESVVTPVKGQYLWTRTVTTYTNSSVVTTYSVAYNATDGQNGKGISSTAVTYQLHTNGTTAPTGTWSATIPAPVKGQYMWTRTIISYTDSSSSTSYSTSYYATDGQKGDKGDTGSAGVGVSTSAVAYQNHTSGSTAPTGTWSTATIAPVKGQYLWTRTITTYTDASSITTYSVAYNATDGQNGSDGKGITSTTIAYQQSTSGSTIPTGSWLSSIPTPVKGRYLWTRTTILYTDSTSSVGYSTSYYATDGQKGDKGDAGYTPLKGVDYFDGVNGQNGADGSSAYLWVMYSQNADGNPMVDSPSLAKYIGIATTSTNVKPASSSSYKWALVKGADGIDGEQGADGRTSYLHIKYSNDGGLTFTSDGGETSGSWIGTYVDFTEADSSSVSSYTWNKVRGDDGKGIASTLIAYQNNASGSTPPTGTWSSSTITPIKGQYLWTRTTTSYTDSSTVVTYSVAYNATDGKGIASTSITYQQSTSGSVVPTGTWLGSIPTPVKGNYLWTRTIITYTDNTTSTGYSTSYYPTDGQKGDKGDAGRSVTSITEEYYKSSSSSSQVGGTWSELAPTWENGWYIWSRTKTTFSDGNPTTTPAVCITGQKGTNGVTYYTWIKYADNSTGTIGLSDNPANKRFMGIAVNQTSETESTDPTKYTWSPLYDNVIVGGRNLILNSDLAVSASGYLVKQYTLSENFVTGETYTVSIKGTVNTGQVFGLWQNGGATGKGNLVYNAVTGVHTLTFQASATTTGNERIITIYNVVSATATSATIEWIQLEKGNINTSYNRAPEDIEAEINGVRDAVDVINDTTLPALEDGLLNKAEKESVRQGLNVVSAEKSGVDTQYNAIYANTFIIGTQERTNLLNAKSSYNTAYQNLVNAIDVVLNVADGTRITSVQVGAVTTRFGEYGTAISTYRTRVEQALDIISARKVSAGIDGIVVSGRNMLQGTSAALETVAFGGWDYYFPSNLIGWEKNKPIVGKIWLEPVSYDASCMIHFRYADSSYLQARGSVVSAGTSGYSIISTTVPNRDDISYIQFSIRHSAGTTPLNEVRYKEAKVEMGTKPTGWSQAPEDVVDAVIGIDSRLSNAESAITEEAITNTVMSTTKFSAKLAEYAKGEALAGYATTDALGAVKDTADSAKKAIEDLDLSPYVQTAQIQQLENSINSRISQSGGVNMLRNSIGWSGIDFWTLVNGTIQTVQTPQLETFGFGSGWHKNHGSTAVRIKQVVNLPIAGTYTISFKMNKNIETTVAGKYSACGIYVDNLPFYGEGTGSGVTSGFEDYSFTFTTTKSQVEIAIVIGELAEATISGVMLNMGSFPLQWTSHSAEVYNTNVRVDINGLQVMGNRNGKKTVITTEEFAGYSNDEKVFTVNEDTTEVKKLKAEQQFAMAPITIITVDNSSYSGWAFV